MQPRDRTPGQVLIGTSGYSYKDWVGPVYPPDLPSDRWLDHYAEQFPFVELNFSYYRMPTIQQMQRYAAVPLQVAIKAHQSLTHQREQAEDQAESMLAALDVLSRDDRLATCLFQFPYSFHYTPDNRRYLDWLLRAFQEFPGIVEFRNPEWMRASVIASLRDREVGLAATDAPAVRGAMPPHATVTGQQGYVRFHGRNAENWYTGDNVSRYDYSYSEAELREWLPRIEEMAVQARTIYFAFNNHARGQAVDNAHMLKSILKDMGVQVK